VHCRVVRNGGAHMSPERKREGKLQCALPRREEWRNFPNLEFQILENVAMCTAAS